MSNVERSLQIIGKDENLKEKILEFVSLVESSLKYNGNIREEVTKYIVDALYDRNDYVIKELKSGVKFRFNVGLGSKVAREFLLSTPKIPEYAWEPQTTRLLEYLAQFCQKILVGGAYFGDQVIPIAKVIENKPDSRVFAFEINALQFDNLNFNINLNNIKNVLSVNQALWSNSSTSLALADTDDLANVIPQEGEVNSVSIDDFLKEEKENTLDMIMLDVEGAEYEIFKGAFNTLSKKGNCNFLIFEVHSNYLDWSQGLRKTPIIEYLSQFGYKFFAIRDFQANFDMKGWAIELIYIDEVYLEGPKHGFNILAIKDTGILQQNEMFRFCSGVSPKYLLHKDPSLHHPIGGFRL